MSHTQPPAPEGADIEIDEEALQKINLEMITSDLITPDRLYADLALFKDYTLGALLGVLAEQKPTLTEADYLARYQSLLAALPAYSERVFDDVAHYFPAFGCTSQAIHTRLRTPAFAQAILHSAPVTKFIEVIQSQIAVNVNHSAVIGKRDPIVLTINTYPLKLDTLNCHLIGLYFSNLLRVNVEVIYLDLTTATLAQFALFDECYSAYFVELFSRPDILTGYSSLKFINKRLFVRRIFGDTVNPTLDLAREELVVQTRMDILTQFRYIPAVLFSPPVAAKKDP